MGSRPPESLPCTWIRTDAEGHPASPREGDVSGPRHKGRAGGPSSMRTILVGALVLVESGCFVITASEVSEHDNLQGDWSGEYTLPDGSEGTLSLRLQDEAAAFSGDGTLDDG